MARATLRRLPAGLPGLELRSVAVLTASCVPEPPHQRPGIWLIVLTIPVAVRGREPRRMRNISLLSCASASRFAATSRLTCSRIDPRLSAFNERLVAPAPVVAGRGLPVAAESPSPTATAAVRGLSLHVLISSTALERSLFSTLPRTADTEIGALGCTPCRLTVP